ncbi:MAG: YdiU family protein [Acidobacteriota bacterium]|nr:YdiU family protein [Acidobacteriota bacterium]
MNPPAARALQSLHIEFDNSYARLPSLFQVPVNPTPVAAPRLLQLNVALATALGLDAKALASAEGTAVLAGNAVADGSEPIALAYAGHQFGYFVPQLGDGRAILLGEVIGRDGARYDIQLKGSGPTPFSRRGDGRAALGPVLREYLLSEAMAALGVPTTRALAAVLSGEPVFREGAVPGAIFTRVAASHLRVGTFQYIARHGDKEALRTLTDYAIRRHYPRALGTPNQARALLDGVIARHAALVAQWLLLGFVHGVMNTDNTSISGETLDYGPCAFLEAYDPAAVFSSIDARGRYAYSNQPHAAHWNLARLAESLLPLLAAEEGDAVASATEALAGFGPQFERARMAGLRRKLGLRTERAGDGVLAEDLLTRMHANRADLTLTFRGLAEAAASEGADAGVRALFADPAAYDVWAVEWRRRLEDEPGSPEDRAAAMRAANPAFIPRNHRVEEVIVAAVERDDLQPFADLLKVTADPYKDQPGAEHYATPALPEQCVTQTFCGT